MRVQADGRRARHLLWTVPLAVLLSLPLWFFAGIMWCGVSGCTGGGFGISRGGESVAWAAVALGGLLVFVAVFAVPWLRPGWMRAVVALTVGVVFVALGVVLTGGPTPPAAEAATAHAEIGSDTGPG